MTEPMPEWYRVLDVDVAGDDGAPAVIRAAAVDALAYVLELRKERATLRAELAALQTTATFVTTVHAVRWPDGEIVTLGDTPEISRRLAGAGAQPIAREVRTVFGPWREVALG